MTREYIVTEAQRIDIIKLLDMLAGTRQIANFFEQGILTQIVCPKPEPEENPDAKKKSESEAAKNADSKAKGKK